MNTLEIEWKHLDKEGNTCVRCSDTGEALYDVVSRLAKECKPYGWEIKLKETKLTEREITESNIILFNGKAIEDLLPEAKAAESHCESCCELTGNESTSCRTVEYGGISYEGIPSSVIRQAVCKIAQCC